MEAAQAEQIEVDENAPSADAADRAAYAKEIYGDRIPTPDTVTEPKDEDPWAGVSPAARQQIEALNAQVAEFNKAQPRIKQLENRVGSLQNELHAAKQAAAAVPKAPSAETPVEVAADITDWNELVEQYPEIGKAVASKIAVSNAEIKKKLDEIESLREELKTKHDPKLTEEIDALKKWKDVTTVKLAHNDFDQIRESEEFHAWRVKNQGDLTLEDPAEAAEFLDRYKKTDVYQTWAGIKTTKTAREIQEANQQRLRQAESIPGRQPPQMRGAGDMTMEEQRRALRLKKWPDSKG